VNAARGRLLILSAAVLWSTSGFFAKSPTLLEIPVESRALTLAFWRAVFATLVLLLFVRRWQFDWRMLPMATCFAAMTWSFLSALVHAEAGLAIWLQYLAPAWVVIFAWLFFREAPDPTSRWMLAFALTGLLVILASQLLALAQRSNWGIAAGLLSGVFFAWVVIFLRRLRHLDALMLVLVNQAVTALVLLPVNLQLGHWPVGPQWFFLAGFGVFQMGLPYLLFALGLRYVTSHEASGLGMLEPLLVPAWVFLAWRNLPDYQAPDRWTLIGGGFILFGLLLQLVLPLGRLRQIKPLAT